MTTTITIDYLARRAALEIKPVRGEPDESLMAPIKDAVRDAALECVRVVQRREKAFARTLHYEAGLACTAAATDILIAFDISPLEDEL